MADIFILQLYFHDLMMCFWLSFQQNFKEGRFSRGGNDSSQMKMAKLTNIFPECIY